MKKKKKQRRYEEDWGKYTHQEGSGLKPGGFGMRVSYLNRNLDDTIALRDGDEGVSTWNNVLSPLAKDLLPPADLQAIVAKYSGGQPLSYEGMTHQQRKQLVQSVVTRLTKALKPGGENDQPQGNQTGPSAQTSKKGQTSAPDVDDSRRPGPENEQGSELGGVDEGPPKESPSSGSGNGPGETPKTWNDLTPEEQESIRQQIENGQVSFDEDAGGTPLDASTFPQDLQKQLGQQAMQEMARRVKEWQSRRQRHEELEKETAEWTGIEEEEEDNLPESGNSQASRQDGQTGDGDEDSEELGAASNADRHGDMVSVEELQRKNHEGPHGGGGDVMNLKVKFKTPEERLFAVIREQMERLGGDPDPSDYRDEGSDAWNPRKVAIAYWKPNVWKDAKRDYAKAPSDIYLILDTSGSVSDYAEMIAAMAAGALGLVHLYHGGEANPEYAILRNTPLNSPHEFRGFGRESQRPVCSYGVPGYREFTASAESFDRNLEWFLQKEKPPKGARLIFWGDTEGVGFDEPDRIARLAKPYHMTWLFPYDLGETYGREFPKLVEVGIQVIGNVDSPEGLRNALKKVR